LRAEVEKWERKSYGELSEMVLPVAYEHGSTPDKDWYAVEVSRLERTPEYVHIAVDVSGKGRTSHRPLVAGVIKYADGRTG
jgi:hypothetical protein